MITKKHLPRRAFLRGAGAAVALPLLDAMFPALGAPGMESKAPRRMAFVYIPNGVEQKYWELKEPGPLAELSRILKPLEPVRDEILVLSGLAQNKGNGRGGDHARALAAYLTGVGCKVTEGADFINGVSVDQLAADRIGSQTRLGSLELGIEDGRQVGVCDPGFSCVYSNNMSWRSPTVPNPPEINPRAVFERMFGATVEDAATKAKRQLYEKSILDTVAEDTRRITGTLGPTDQRKLDEYLSSVREIETRIQKAEKQSVEITPDIPKPVGIPPDYAEHVRLMFDLIAVAFQANITRTITFMLGREQTARPFREIGISDGFHPLTHHSNKPDMVEKVAQIDVYITQQFLHLVQKMKSISDGDGTLLDHSMVVYGAGLGDGNRHSHDDLPVLIAGRGLGIKPGRHIVYPKNTAMNNLFLTMLERMGIEMDNFADSTGKLRFL